MANIALAFAVLEITDSAAALGQVLAAHTIPVVIFLLGGGVIADRFPRAVVLQVSNIVSGVLQGAIALLVITGTAEIWMLVVLTPPGRRLGSRLPGDGQHHAPAGPARPAPAGQRAELPDARQPEHPGPDGGRPPRGHGRGGLGPDGRRPHLVRRGTAPAPGVRSRRDRPGPRTARAPSPSCARAGPLLADHVALGRRHRLLLPERHPLRGDLHPRPDGGAGDVRRAGLGAGALGGVGGPDPDDDRDAARPAPATAAARDAGNLRARPADPDAGRASRAPRHDRRDVRGRGRDRGVLASAGTSPCRRTSTSRCSPGPTPTTRSARSWRFPWASSPSVRSPQPSATRTC